MILFFLDGTKQLLSSGMLHFVNISFSVFIGSKEHDQCGIYLMSFVFDISVGILICWYMMKLLDKFLTYKNSKVGLPTQVETEER
jgi:flagellar biosynthesis protein FliR